MDIHSLLNQVSGPILLAIAGAALRFIQKIQADIHELTMSTKELHYKLTYQSDKIEDMKDTLYEHEERIAHLEKEY